MGGGEKRGLHGPGPGRFLGSLALGRMQADLLIGSLDADSASAPGRTGCRSEQAQCEWTGEKDPPHGAWNSRGRRDTGVCVAASLCCSLSQRCLLSCCTPIQKKTCCVCGFFFFKWYSVAQREIHEFQPRYLSHALEWRASKGRNSPDVFTKSITKNILSSRKYSSDSFIVH